MSSTVRVMPKARQAQLVVEELVDETLVYDEDRHEAHCLNQTAAFVWKHCDGRTTVSRMARILGKQMNTPVSEEVVHFALQQLEKSHLLELPEARATQKHTMSRRALVQTLGLAAATMVPLVSSIAAPAAAVAASCQGNGQPCSAGIPCCPGLTCAGTCS
jgi:coenzyme PQQ synthesis protein D (PqqD)